MEKARRRRPLSAAFHEIASEDDESISNALLEWSGLAPVWNEHELSRLFSFGPAVAFECQHIRLKTKEWSNLPGHGGVWYTVLTNNEKALKAEMNARLEGLLRDHQKLIRDNVEEAREIARVRAENINRGPLAQLLVAEGSVTFVIQQFAPNAQHSIAVSHQDWTDIQQGQPIEYQDIPFVYEGLIFHETWHFNVQSKGSVWVGMNKKPSYAGTLGNFAPVAKL